MYFIYTAVICLLTVTSATCQRLSDLPQDVIEDWTSILYNGTTKARSCNSASARLTEYWIYSRDNPSTPTIVKQTEITTTASRSKIIFVTHGWLQNASTPVIADIKNAYLVRYDAYVVLVNWGAYSGTNYFCAYQTVAAIGNNIAKSLCHLKEKNGVALDEVHVVGHSLGAHIMGFAGRTVRSTSGVKLGRITGLDPAGPLYDGIQPIYRLDPLDAHFVDVLHTAVGTAGYRGSLGQLDSYANCGYVQPGCTDISKLDIKSLLDLPMEVLTCSHLRSCVYFTESINSNKFVARECGGCGAPVCFPTLLGNTRKVIGEGDTTRGRVRNYVFNTHSSPPYAEG